MTKIISFIHGLYPRSENLVMVSRDADRGRKTADDLANAQERDTQALLAKQKSLGFSYIEDGKFLWDDIFRPIIESTEGFSVGPITRWFDNNNFYKEPIITGKLRVDMQKLAHYFPAITPKEKWKVTLPSPYLFAKLTKSKNPMTFENILFQVTLVIRDVIAYLETQGVAFIQLNEPAMPYYGATKKELGLFAKAIKKLTLPEKQHKLVVHFYFGDATSAIKSLVSEKIGIDGIGVDFYKTSLTSLPKKMPYTLLAGIMDGRNSLLENEVQLKKFIRAIIKRYKPEVLYISSNSDLELLPEAVAKNKLAILGNLQKAFAKK